MAKQARTRRATVASIMSSPEFETGLNDARQGTPFDCRNGSWGYERGRLFGHIAPITMPLYIGGKLNLKALALCSAAFERRLII